MAATSINTSKVTVASLAANMPYSTKKSINIFCPGVVGLRIQIAATGQFLPVFTGRSQTGM
jgi:hypothetical protein